MGARHGTSISNKVQLIGEDGIGLNRNQTKIQVVQLPAGPNQHKVGGRGIGNIGTVYPINPNVDDRGTVSAASINVAITDPRHHYTKMSLNNANPTINIIDLIVGLSSVFTLDLTNSIALSSLTFVPTLINQPTLNLGSGQRNVLFIVGHRTATETRYEVIGGGGGEVFTWTADHSANSFDLTNLDRLRFVSSSNAPATNADPTIYIDAALNMVFNVADQDQWFWTNQNQSIMQLNRSGVNNDTILTVETDSSNASAIPHIDLFRDDPSPVNDDEFGRLRFLATDSALNLHVYAQIAAEYENVTDGREASSLIFATSFDTGATTQFLAFMALNAANSGDVDMFRDVNMNNNSINTITNIIGRDDATQFQIIFDGAEDSDTAITNQVGVADRINVFANNINGTFFLFNSTNTEFQMGIPNAVAAYWSLGNHRLEFDAMTIPPDSVVGNDSGVVFFDTATDPGILKIKKKSTLGAVSTISLEAGGGVSFPIIPPVDVRGNVSTTQNIDLSLTTAHVTTMTLTANIIITFSNFPATANQIEWEVEIKQDATGGRTVTWPAAVTPTPVIDSAANATTIVVLRTNDNGTIIRTLTSSGGGGDASLWANFPAVADVNFATFDGINIDRLLFDQATGSLLGATDVGITSTATGDLAFNVAAGNSYDFAFGGSVSPIRFQINNTTVVSQSIFPAQDALDTLGGAGNVWQSVHTVFLQSDATTPASAGFIRMGNDEAIAWDMIGTGNATLEVDANDDFDFRLNGAQEFTISSTGVDLHDNGINWSTTGYGHTITPTTTSLELNTGVTTDTIFLQTGGGTILSLTNTGSTFFGDINANTNDILNMGDGTIFLLTTVTAVAGDFVMIRDATDSTLKKVDASDFLGGGGVQDKIEEGDSKVEVIDTGTGQVDIFVDGATAKFRFLAAGFSPVSAGAVNLGTASLPWEKLSIKDIEIETGGTLTITKNNLVATATGIVYNVPSADVHTFQVNGTDTLIIDEDEIRFRATRAHKIVALGTALQLVTENTTDDLQIFTGASRSNVTVLIEDLKTTFFTTSSQTSAYALQIVQNNVTPAAFRTIANIDLIAENTVSIDTIYARISASSQVITSTVEDGLLQLGIVSGGTLIAAIDMEGSGSAGANDAKIGFFGVTPVVQQTLASSPTTTQISTALRNLGLTKL